ncbi:hypothetical protein A2U01_0099938, partial [Trifolium medium]|nr:hypothetical protein [Trifolium medium]
ASRDVTINEKEQWNWETASTGSERALPFIFEDDHDEEDVVAATPTPNVNTGSQIRRSERETLSYGTAAKSHGWRKA